MPLHSIVSGSVSAGLHRLVWQLEVAYIIGGVLSAVAQLLSNSDSPALE